MDANDDENDPIHVLLREHTGREAPPDLAAAVATRFLAGDAPRAAGRLRWQAPAGAGATPLQLWLAAVVVLSGLAAVLGTVWLQRQAADATATVAAPQDPVPQDPVPKDAIPAGTLQLRVVDRNGAPVQSFELDLARALGGNTPARIPNLPRRQIEPRDFVGDSVAIAGLEPGSYIALVNAVGHARTRSEPFSIGEQGARLTLQLQVGGALHGVVLGPDGKPLAGAVVRTAAPLPPGLPAESSLLQMFVQNMVQLHTDATTRTGEDGTWRLRNLGYGSHRILFEHPDFCSGTPATLDVVAGDQELRTVTLVRGARIHGKATAAGKGLGDVEITLRSGEPDAEPRPDARIWRARTGADGAFVLPSRVPPGVYTIQGVSTGQTKNPFEKLQEIKNSQRAVEVRQGDTDLEADVQIGGG